MSPGFNGTDLFRLLGSFVLVLALLAALLWALRRLQTKIISQNAGRKLQLLEVLSVGTRQKVALVRVGDREVLIGISPTQICALTGEMATKSNISTDTLVMPESNRTEAQHVA
jgi:flagellar protein FliO/FliZ